MKDRKKKNEKNIAKHTNTDTIISNLQCTSIYHEGGTLIENSDDNGSFQSINCTVYGEEVDVDDL